MLTLVIFITGLIIGQFTGSTAAGIDTGFACVALYLIVKFVMWLIKSRKKSDKYKEANLNFLENPRTDIEKELRAEHEKMMSNYRKNL